MINKWIFVISEYSNYNYGSVEDTLKTLDKEREWKIGLRTVHRNKLKENDKIIFYVTGEGNQYFVAQAVLDSEFIHEGDPIYGYVKIKNLSFFDTPLKIRPLLKKLKFIKNERYWGLHFQGGVIPLIDKDYNEIYPDKFTFIDLFSGLGGMRIAFERAGGTCIWSDDYDKDAQRVYYENFNEIPAGDIYKIESKDIPKHDILIAGFPCPTYSIIGNRNGINRSSVFDYGQNQESDRKGRLFFQIIRILRDKQPHSFLLENVKGLSSISKGKLLEMMVYMLENLGYFVHVEILNALDFGLPQKRERVIIVGFKTNYDFKFPKVKLTMKPLSQILENDEDVDDFYFASKKIRDKRHNSVKDKKVFYPSIWHENKSRNISILPYSVSLRASASYNYLLVNGIRRLTPREMLRLQGYPEEYKISGTYTSIRKLTGNSVPIPMIEAVARNMIKAISENIIQEEIEETQLSMVM